MKSLILTSLLLVVTSCAIAQTGVSPYVFPAFTNASVLQKGGGVTEASMNYNTLTQEMLFMQSGEKLVLDLGDKVDTIYMKTENLSLLVRCITKN